MFAIWHWHVMREAFASVLMARNASALGTVFDAVKPTGVKFPRLSRPWFLQIMGELIMVVRIIPNISKPR